jgi:hypothetical protein
MPFRFTSEKPSHDQRTIIVAEVEYVGHLPEHLGPWQHCQSLDDRDLTNESHAAIHKDGVYLFAARGGVQFAGDGVTFVPDMIALPADWGVLEA